MYIVQGVQRIIRISTLMVRKETGLDRMVIIKSEVGLENHTDPEAGIGFSECQKGSEGSLEIYEQLENRI